MPNPSPANSWTKEAEVEIWILEPDAIKELFAFLGQFVLLLFKKLPSVIQLTPSPLKIGLQLIDLGFLDDLGLLDLCCQLLLTLRRSSEVPPCLHQLIVGVFALKM
ncbi:hypothetical protein ACOSP7_018496 [Xanthoceras sorbifolium]